VIERFFNWFYGRIGESFEALGEAAVAQAQQPIVRPATVAGPYQVLVWVMRKRVLDDLVGAHSEDVWRPADADEIHLWFRCPVCKERITAALLAPDVLHFRADKRTFLDHVIAKSKSVVDLHSCELDLA
jgi:hypothetical protein